MFVLCVRYSTLAIRRHCVVFLENVCLKFVLLLKMLFQSCCVTKIIYSKASDGIKTRTMYNHKVRCEQCKHPRTDPNQAISRMGCVATCLVSFSLKVTFSVR